MNADSKLLLKKHTQKKIIGEKNNILRCYYSKKK